MSELERRLSELERKVWELEVRIVEGEREVEKATMLGTGARLFPCPYCGRMTPVYLDNIYGSGSFVSCLYCDGDIQLKVEAVKAKTA